MALALGACGGSSAKPVEAPPAEDDELGEVYEPSSDLEPEEPEPPPPPATYSAKATLAPLKGAKVKPTTVTFFQTEGETTQVSADSPFEGLKAGTYHLVIHEPEACGKNAAKMGPVWAPAAEVPLELVVTKALDGSIDVSTDLMLDGDDSIVGRTLVLHADKKGRPAKALACGPIAAGEDD